ncbi:MAG: PH domain-containing protein [Planctomycetia bacterium]|nr:PH domain-containing protein [Planctomycetia bacterium]
MSNEPLNVSSSASQSDGEPVLKWKGCHYSGKAFRAQFLLYLLLTVAWWAIFWYFWAWFDKRFYLYGIALMAIGIPLVLLWIPFWCRYLYRTWTIIYTLEPDRLITQCGFFKIRKETLNIGQINDISFDQTVWDKLLNGGVGTVELHTSDKTDPILFLKGLDDPNAAFDTLDMLKNRFIKKRGIKSLGGDLLGDMDSGGM